MVNKLEITLEMERLTTEAEQRGYERGQKEGERRVWEKMREWCTWKHHSWNPPGGCYNQGGFAKCTANTCPAMQDSKPKDKDGE